MININRELLEEEVKPTFDEGRYIDELWVQLNYRFAWYCETDLAISNLGQVFNTVRREFCPVVYDMYRKRFVVQIKTYNGKLAIYDIANLVATAFDYNHSYNGCRIAEIENQNHIVKKLYQTNEEFKHNCMVNASAIASNNNNPGGNLIPYIALSDKLVPINPRSLKWTSNIDKKLQNKMSKKMTEITDIEKVCRAIEISKIANRPIDEKAIISNLVDPEIFTKVMNNVSSIKHITSFFDIEDPYVANNMNCTNTDDDDPLARFFNF